MTASRRGAHCSAYSAATTRGPVFSRLAAIPFYDSSAGRVRAGHAALSACTAQPTAGLRTMTHTVTVRRRHARPPQGAAPTAAAISVLSATHTSRVLVRAMLACTVWDSMLRRRTADVADCQTTDRVRSYHAGPDDEDPIMNQVLLAPAAVARSRHNTVALHATLWAASRKPETAAEQNRCSRGRTAIRSRFCVRALLTARSTYNLPKVPKQSH